MSTFLSIFFIQCIFLQVQSTWIETPAWIDELFGDGDFNAKSERLVQKHISSSTEDLKILFEAETSLWNGLRNHKNETEVLSFYFNHLDYELDAPPNPEEYVSHPVNAFHLIKRTSTWMPKVKAYLANSSEAERQNFSEVIEALSSLVLPDRKDFEFGASYGIVTYQFFHDCDTKLLAKGILVDSLTGKEYKSTSPLTSDELLSIAMVAKTVYQLNSYVTWCQAALDAAKNEGKPQQALSKIKKMISNGKKDHDEEILHHGFFRGMVPSDPETIIQVNEVPYNKDLMKSTEWLNYIKKRKLIEKHMESFENLISDERRAKFGDPQLNTVIMSCFLTNRIKHLCNGQNVRPPRLDSKLRCFYVHHGNPFLILGPFKYELKHEVPEIGLFHDLVSDNEIRAVKQRSRGQMRSTPFVVKNNIESDYSKLRTSKVLYLNERKEPIAAQLSQKVELAMRFVLYKDYMDSENYQIMNYGIGGTISGHVDSPGARPGSSEWFGGSRITTFMIYLSSVPVGGLTIFPQAGVSIQPEAGSAVYWFNHNALGGYDSRVFHLGCPVGFGNKWIANKWVKWPAQMWNYKCKEQPHTFSIHKKGC